MDIRDNKSNVLGIGFFGLEWPFISLKEGYISQQTVSENFSFYLVDTISISCLNYTSKVIKLHKENNPLVTKAFNSQVVTSETIRLLNTKSYSALNNNIVFKE